MIEFSDLKVGTVVNINLSNMVGVVSRCYNYIARPKLASYENIICVVTAIFSAAIGSIEIAYINDNDELIFEPMYYKCLDIINEPISYDHRILEATRNNFDKMIYRTEVYIKDPLKYTIGSRYVTKRNAPIEIVNLKYKGIIGIKIKYKGKSQIEYFDYKDLDLAINKPKEIIESSHVFDINNLIFSS